MRTCATAIAVVGSLLLLLACAPSEPAPEACDDFRIITYYDNLAMPITSYAWTGPHTRPVCIVTERKVARP